MTRKGVRLTAGLLVAALMVTTIPVECLGAETVEGSDYVTGISYNFSAGAHSSISETVVLEGVSEDLLYAGLEGNNNPTVAAPASPYSNIAICTANEYLNIRQEAREDAKVLGKLYRSDAATVLETLDGWYKVASGSVVGYVAAEYVVVGDEDACKAASEYIGKVQEDAVALRKDPSIEAEVSAILSRSNQVTILDDSLDVWYKVQYGNYVGYIAKNYIYVETIYSYAESVEEEEARLAEERRKQEEAKKQQASSSNKTYSAPSGKNGQAVVNYAVQFVGNPYVWGGTSLTKGADCSGFVMKVYEAFGVSLPHSSYALRSVGYAVSAADVQPGDIICYSGHVAIYIGDGKIVHASNRRDGIKISYNWQYQKVLAIRRIF